MWWCPTCKRNISGKEVTYEEYHETCGTYLGNCQDQSDEEKLQACVNYLLEYNLTPDEYKELYKKFNSLNR